MLPEWLEPAPPDFFLRNHVAKRRPYAKPQSAQRAAGIFKWNLLDRLLPMPTTDVLVISRGRLADRPVPRNLDDTRILLRDGIGLVIRHAEQLDVPLAALAHSLTKTMPGTAHVQLFVTPAETHGFSWHYDAEEVFIVQTAGVKDYFLRENTVAASALAMPDFGRFRDEVSPVGSVRLIEGDWLYIPGRWWHMAKCVEDSLSISIGVSPDESWLTELKRKR